MQPRHLANDQHPAQPVAAHAEAAPARSATVGFQGRVQVDARASKRRQ